MENKVFQMKKKTIIGISIGVALVLVIAIVYALYNRVHEANLLEFIASGHEPAILVTLEEGWSDLQVGDIIEELLAHPEVNEVSNRGYSEAWEEFKEKYFDEIPTLVLGGRHDGYLLVFVTSEEPGFFTSLLGVDNLQRTINELAEYAESIEGVRRVSRNTVRR